MKKPILKLVVLMIPVALMGCATHPATDAPPSPDSEAYARKVIIEKVDAAVQAQRELAATTEEGKALLLKKQAALDEDEVDIDYMGKAEPLLDAIAVRYGYHFVETGKHEDLPTINIRVQHRRVLEVLRDIGYQIDSGADVVLDKDAKIIRLVYKNKKG